MTHDATHSAECVCSPVYVGMKESGSYNLNPDCPVHGTRTAESVWRNGSPEGGETVVQNADYVLDLLSAWQSVHALLPPRLRAETEALNRQTVEVLQRHSDGPGSSTPPKATHSVDPCASAWQ